MAIELHDLLAPALLRGFAAMATFLDKARDWADTQGIAHAALLDARLIADMAPLTAQVQRASDTAKGGFVRIGGIDNVAMADDEASFADLQSRIARTVAFIESVPRAAIDGKEAAPVVLTTPGGDIPFTAICYAQGFVLPNFYFHVTTAYAILRMQGVPLGKLDYLGAR
ncbi:DUF1993 domain-containing protein [Sphingomonas sp.]|uniref:DUF1993 domain-containing protein n=1 Tax=Sphingomonas sp. TaxID=28214 RepID=UPI002C112C50|nr:DUF1993 domain-containing protein [Sphingomonas sp.]HWK35353.1 DUF1993 domain-containing protein [Sphingomonas sp.]